MRFILFLSLPLAALDQWTKYLVLEQVDPEKPLKPKFFQFVNYTNTGAAFGSFKDKNAFFIAISGIALVIVLVLLVRKRGPDAWRDVSLALLLTGILGNLTDRLVHGHVIDFLLFDFGKYAPKIFHPWPAFNVADACITIAVVCFIIHSFMAERTKAKTTA